MPSRSLYDERKEKGVCVDCGGSLDRPGKLRCRACGAYHELYRAWAKGGRAGDKPKKGDSYSWPSEQDRPPAPTDYYALRAAGLCPVCGGERDRAPKLLCSVCAEKDAARKQKRLNEGMCFICGTAPAEPGSKYCAKHADRARRQVTARWTVRPVLPSRMIRPARKIQTPKRIGQPYYWHVKERVIARYGGECLCCGEKTPIFMEFHHVNFDGKRHRQEIAATGGKDIYRWLLDNDCPDTLEMLCSNCHKGIHRNHGVCPHQEWRVSDPSQDVLRAMNRYFLLAG